MVIFDGTETSHLDSCKLQILLEGSLVNGSQNYVVAQRFSMTAEELEDSLQRQRKHLVENTKKVISAGS
jgi:hypothetical protein